MGRVRAGDPVERIGNDADTFFFLFSYQIPGCLDFAQAVAVVVSLRDARKRVGVFRLTEPDGMQLIQQCVGSCLNMILNIRSLFLLLSMPWWA